ncbi:amidohydrolase [Paenibacillaceae bacterium]|nr:amidohydrolase [Paenibacillaceae bacterium]
MQAQNNLRLINVSLPLQDRNERFEVTVSEGRYSSIVRQQQTVPPEGTSSLDSLLHDADRANPALSASFVPDRAGIFGKEQQETVIDVGGRIMLPGLADAHMHLDKAFTSRQIGNLSGTLLEAIRNFKAASPSFTHQQLKERMMTTIRHAMSFGTTAIRTHLDFNYQAGIDVAMRTVYAALEVKEALRGRVELQLFPLCQFDRMPGAALEALEEALRLGVDGIGGAPHLSADPHADIDTVFRLAQKYGKPIDLHADENDDPAVRTVEYIARQTIAQGYQGKVTVGHLCSLAAMAHEDAESIIGLMAEARLMAITLPGANMYLQGRGDRGVVRRGVTRVKELVAAGVPLAVASDNIQDPFHPFGRGDLLQIGLLAAYAAHMSSEQDQLELLRMITEVPATIMGLDGWGIEEGNAANFAIFDAATVGELLAWLPSGRWINRGGEWTVVSKPLTIWQRD